MCASAAVSARTAASWAASAALFDARSAARCSSGAVACVPMFVRLATRAARASAVRASAVSGSAEEGISILAGADVDGVVCNGPERADGTDVDGVENDSNVGAGGTVDDGAAAVGVSVGAGAASDGPSDAVVVVVVLLLSRWVLSIASLVFSGAVGVSVSIASSDRAAGEIPTVYYAH